MAVGALVFLVSKVSSEYHQSLVARYEEAYQRPCRSVDGKIRKEDSLWQSLNQSTDQRNQISPLIIEDSLNSVSEWTTTQDPNEERALSVKVSPKAAELIASIPVDEESPPVAIVITLPSAYPLHPAIVAGKSRVLVDEKKWRSWLLTIQGVIMFSNGNLVDGLLAFRKNVQGALQGQSECAICYSVISTDMQTPNKRCATCKNTFHSVCLFRWFKSSNQSTCPLCRNNFVYV